jgi:YVTN family beta-propeller protein
VVDVASGTTLATLPVGVEPTGLAVSPDGTRVYVVSQAEKKLTIVDATANAVAANVGLPSQPREVVVAPDGRRLWVSTFDAVLVLDAARLQ